MAYVGWPTGVNRSVLDSTQLTVGEGATKEDSLEIGKKKSRLLMSIAPKKFSVTMRFNYSKKDEMSGLSEKDRFFQWYEHILKYSTNEFCFSDLMYGIDSDTLAWYRITDAVQGIKSGLDTEVHMTWESVYEGEIVFTPSAAEVSRIEAVDGAVTVYFTDIPQTAPTPMSFTLTRDSSNISVPVKSIRFFGNTGDLNELGSDHCIVYFDKLCDEQEHSLKVTSEDYTGGPWTDTFQAEAL